MNSRDARVSPMLVIFCPPADINKVGWWLFVYDLPTSWWLIMFNSAFVPMGIMTIYYRTDVQDLVARWAPCGVWGNYNFMFTWNVMLSIAVIYLLLRRSAMIAVAQAAYVGADSLQSPNLDTGDNWLWYASWLIGEIVIGIILYSLIKHHLTFKTLKAFRQDNETGIKATPKRQAWHQKIIVGTQDPWW